MSMAMGLSTQRLRHWRRRLPTAAGALLWACLAPAAAIVQYPLDAQRVYNIKVHLESRGVTTVMFPSAIEAVHGNNVVAEDMADDYLGDFVMRFEPGSYFFSLRARRQPATGALNIIFNRKTYVLNLLADAGGGSSSVTFAGSNSGGSARSARVTPRIILSLIDIAKSWDNFQQHQPGAVAAVMHAQPQQVTRYELFEVHLRDVWRWDEYDTLVLRCLLVNKDRSEPIYYNQRDLAVRVGDTIYYASVVDASGVMPPNAGSFAYFAITGHPFGGRNNLAVDNRFTVLVAEARPPSSAHGEKIVPSAAPPEPTPTRPAAAAAETTAATAPVPPPAALTLDALAARLQQLQMELLSLPPPERLRQIQQEIHELSLLLVEQ